MAKAYEELELNRCSEDTALTLNDGTVKIILNTKAVSYTHLTLPTSSRV